MRVSFFLEVEKNVDLICLFCQVLCTGFKSGRCFYFVGHTCKVVGLLVSNDGRVVCFHVRGLCWWCNVAVAHGWKFTKPTMLNITTGKQQWFRLVSFLRKQTQLPLPFISGTNVGMCHIPKQTSSEEFRPINFCSCVVRNKTMHA